MSPQYLQGLRLFLLRVVSVDVDLDALVRIERVRDERNEGLREELLSNRLPPPNACASSASGTAGKLNEGAIRL